MSIFWLHVMIVSRKENIVMSFGVWIGLPQSQAKARSRERKKLGWNIRKLSSRLDSVNGLFLAVESRLELSRDVTRKRKISLRFGYLLAVNDSIASSHWKALGWQMREKILIRRLVKLLLELVTRAHMRGAKVVRWSNFAAVWRAESHRLMSALESEWNFH